jgi:hypothetical protein
LISTQVKIHRDDPEELYVTVRDASGQERQTVWKSNFDGVEAQVHAIFLRIT